MAVWKVTVRDHAGEEVGGLSLVGTLADAVCGAVRHFPGAWGITVRQHHAAGGPARGTDGCDSLGRELKHLLPLNVYSYGDVAEVRGEEEDEEEEGGEGDDSPLARWLAMKFLPTDRGFREDYEPGDSRCRCSRCGRRVAVGQETVGFGYRSRHYRYHAECLGIEFIL